MVQEEKESTHPDMNIILKGDDTIKRKIHLIFSFFLALFLCIHPLSTIAFAANTEEIIPTEDSTLICYTYSLEGNPAYFERSSIRTINAIAYPNQIEVYIVFSDEPNIVYNASLLRDAYHSLPSLVSDWVFVIQDALKAMSVQGGLLDAIDEEPQPFTLTSESPTIFELFIDEIEAVYGASGTSSWISIMRMYPSQAKYVYIKEYYDADVEYWGKQVTLGDITVAALATLLGVVPCVLIQGLGIAAEYIIPHGSSFQLYLCTAFFERVCMVGTSLSNMDGPYYRASAELKHIGILDPENLYQAIVTMDPTPHYTFYDPSESVFSSVDELARLTKLSYEAST